MTNTWKEKRPYSITAVEFPNTEKENKNMEKTNTKNALEERTTDVRFCRPMHIGEIIEQMNLPTPLSSRS